MALSNVRILTGPKPYQVLQRDESNTATFTISGTTETSSAYIYTDDGAQRKKLLVRAAYEGDNSSVETAEWKLVDLNDNGEWQTEITLPVGGPYRIDTKMVLHEYEQTGSSGDHILHLYVGDLWVIAGQSNATGYGKGIAEDAPQLGVSCYYADGVWKVAAHPLNDATNAIYTAHIDELFVEYSPWLKFAKDVYKKTAVPIGLIPTALGGSPLCAWEPVNGKDSYLYNNMIDFINGAGGKIAGILWYQGCSDTGNEESLTYKERFIKAIEDMRAKLGNFALVTVQLNILIEKQEDFIDENWLKVREAQRLAANILQNSAMITTRDIGVSDCIHNSANGCIVIGQRAALAALGLKYGLKVRDYYHIEPISIKYVDDKKDTFVIEFNNSGDNRLLQNRSLLRDFFILDEKGEVKPKITEIISMNRVKICLERPTEGEATVSVGWGAQGVSPELYDSMLRPIAAFYKWNIS